MVDSHSLIHLELLASIKFLQSLDNRYAAVESVVRELIRADTSPLRSAVVAKYGGLEHLIYSQSDQNLMDRTFHNPEWYVASNAHYPLLFTALERLRTGEIDADYNEIGRDYEADQGVSARAFCPIYLAAKTEVLAIETALEKRVEKDFYVTDLFDLFRAVLERSTFKPDVWNNPLANSEFPTPYSYMLYEIAEDIRNLSEIAVRTSMSKTTPPSAGKPGRVAGDLSRTWSYCIWDISDSERHVSPEFRNGIIERHLLFVLALHSQPSELNLPNDLHGLEVWRDLFLGDLKDRFRGERRQTALSEAMKSLDQGKMFVSEGYEWLEKELFGQARGT